MGSGSLTPRILDEDLAHGLGSSGEEMGPVGPVGTAGFGYSLTAGVTSR